MCKKNVLCLIFFEHFSSRDSGEISHGSAENIGDFEENDHFTYPYLSDDEEDGEDEFETEWKTISLQEYKILMNLIPKVQKLQNTINEMAEKIKSRDSQLEILRQAHRKEQNKCINVSNLSNVSNSVESSINSTQFLFVSFESLH